MRVYFIFNIKEEFKKLYINNQRVLFNVLKQISNIEKEEITFGYNMFSQLINPINKEELDTRMFLKLHKEYVYSKKNDTHYLNNLYKDEISRMTIKKTYIKIEAEQLGSSFLEEINKLDGNFFLCEFNNIDYCFLKEHFSKEYVVL